MKIQKYHEVDLIIIKRGSQVENEDEGGEGFGDYAFLR
jgi:hypothetical protein